MYYERLSRRRFLTLACSDKDNYIHWLALGWETQDPKKALEYFLQALELKPGDPVVLDSIASLDEKQAAMDGKVTVRSGLDQFQTDSAITAQATFERHLTAVSPGWAERTRHPALPYLLYLLALTMAEFLTALSTPQVGLVLHGLLLVGLFFQAAFSVRKIQYRLYLILALAPLVRLLSLSMPLLQFELTNWYMLIGLPLLAAAFIAMRQSDYKPAQVGLVLGRKWGLQMLVAVSGLGLGYLEYLILRPEPLVESLTWVQLWYPALVLLVFTGFLEEWIFRGLLQQAALQGLGRWGLVYTAAVFAVLHIGYQSGMDILFVFLVGLFFSLVVQRSGSIWGVTLAHGLTNIALFLIFPFYLG